MSAYELSYQTAPGRCAWCWEPLPAAETHTVVTAARPPHLELHFHHPCWDAYRSTSGVKLGPVGSSHDWTAERIETLRIGAGMTLRAFAKELGVTESTYRRILAGDESAFGPGVSTRLRRFASVARFESKSPIDWSDPRALFCLRMHLRLRKGALARAIGTSDQQIAVWDRDGVPRRSVRTWGRLARLAAKQKFDASMVVDDRLWTPELLREAIERSSRSIYQWGAAAGWSYQAVQQWAAGTRPIHREAAWGLTRAAVEFGQPLPQEGVVGYRKGAWSRERRPLSPEHEAKRLAALAESKWTLDLLRQLGTMPDRELAVRLGRTRNSVAIMRRTLGIASVDARYWDGSILPQQLADDEILSRWEVAKVRFRTAKTRRED